MSNVNIIGLLDGKTRLYYVNEKFVVMDSLEGDIILVFRQQPNVARGDFFQAEEVLKKLGLGSISKPQLRVDSLIQIKAKEIAA